MTIGVIFLVFGFGASAPPAIKAWVSKVNLTPLMGTIIYGDFLPMYTKNIRLRLSGNNF